MEQVDPEAIVQHLLLQVTIGRGKHPYVDPQDGIVTDPLQVAVLQYPQQFCLQAQRQFTDFVEEQCAVIGHFELAGAMMDRPGEGTFDMAEQLTLSH